MANYRMGDVIRLTRMAKGMTQEQLSAGVCSVETLSRMENGKTKVKKETYRQLMEKMQLPSEQNYAICLSSDMELIEEKEYFEDAMAKHDFKEADSYIKRIKRLAGENESTQQYVKRESKVLDFYQGRITEEELVQELEQLVREIIPEYEKYIDSEVIYPFRQQEIILLRRLAGTYAHIEEYEKSIEICNMLLRSLREGYMAEWEEEEMIVMANLSKYYSETGEFRKSLELCFEVLPKAKKYSYASVVEFVLFEIGWDKLKLIERGEEREEEIEVCKKYIKRAYFLCAARCDDDNKKKIEDFYQEYFSQNIESFAL